MRNVLVETPRVDAELHKLDAWKKGKNPWILVSTTESNRPYVKKRANDVWGNPKEAFYNIYGRPKKGEQAY